MQLPFPLNAVADLGYSVFEGPYNLNLVAERRFRSTPGGGDDFLHCVYQTRNGGAWNILSMQAETEPGLAYMEEPMNPHGAAAFKMGQYRLSHKRGLHRGRPALVQARTVTVYRDNDRNNTYDYDPDSAEDGVFACNIHSVRNWGDLAGCIGISQTDMNLLLALYDQQTKQFGKDYGITLTVLDVPELFAMGGADGLISTPS